MRNRHERRKATAQRRTELKSATLDQHFEETLRRVRTEFERAGELHQSITRSLGLKRVLRRADRQP